MALINVECVSKSFDELKAVDKLSLSVNRSEVLGFLGPNGAGKSTTIKMITGFLRPDAGDIYIDGEEITQHPIHAKSKIGYLPEGVPLYPDMRVYDYLQFIAGVRGIKRTERKSRIQAVAKRVNITAVLGATIDTLSKGFKRRVGLAQAILHDPMILILDEPTDGLDPNQKHEMRGLIAELAQEKAILISTHILEEVEALCDRVAVIASGRLVADAATAHLLLKHDPAGYMTIALSGIAEAHYDQALSKLNQIAKLDVISRTSAFTSLRLYVKQTDASVKALTAVAVAHNWTIESINTQSGRLDTIFRSITQKIQKLS